MIQKFKIALAIAFLSLLSYSCAGRPEVAITEDTLYEKPMPKVEYEYELGPGDVLEIIYHDTPQPDTKEYRLSVGDILKVECEHHSEINRDVTVRPDGNITLPRIGDVDVLGLSTNAIRDKLTNLFSKDFRDPSITVTVIQSNRAIDYLKIAITTSERGQSKLSTVRPDGYLSMPIINDVMARGKTLPELKRAITAEYDKIIDNLTLSIVLWEMKANLVYITGEVAKPDYYLMEGPNTVSQIVARAGGFLDTSEKKSVLVISRDEQRRPWGRLVDMEKVFSSGDISQDVVLHQYDVVYVPKSSIARRDLFVEQYISRLLPSFFTAGYNVGGTMLQHAPLVK